jgi:alpha-tubulin N-acetyltransferase 1
MEFQFDLSHIAHDQIIKIDNSLLPVGYQKDDPELQRMISNVLDKMGIASGIAQELKSPITSAEKLMRSDHILYLMTEQTSPGHFVVVGLLKMGWKKLYLFNKKGSRTEAMVYCLLDFYIHETRQRHGYGIKLMDYMLKDNQIEARQLAVDQPTNKLLQFLWKYFNLSKLVNQGNNFVIFEEFFEDPSEKESATDNRSSGYKSQPTFGRHGAARQQDCMANILYGAKPAEIQNGNGNVDRVEHQQRENKQHHEERHVEVQHHVEVQQHHAMDEGDGQKSNHTHPKLDIKNFHTQLW